MLQLRAELRAVALERRNEARLDALQPRARVAQMAGGREGGADGWVSGGGWCQEPAGAGRASARKSRSHVLVRGVGKSWNNASGPRASRGGERAAHRSSLDAASRFATASLSACLSSSACAAFKSMQDAITSRCKTEA